MCITGKEITGMISKLLLTILLLGIFALCILFPVWAMIDCINSDQREKKAKMGWAILIMFTWWLGALIYWVATMGKRRSS
jgi:hypothetical protein